MAPAPIVFYRTGYDYLDWAGVFWEAAPVTWGALAMPHGRAEDGLGPIWCPHCEKVTDHRMSQLQRVDPDDLPLEPAEPPTGTRYIVTCLTCRIIHSWWARPATG